MELPIFLFLNGHLQNILPQAAEYTFFLAVNKTFFKIGHILGHKASLQKYKKLKACILSVHNGIKLGLIASETIKIL
jgi:hypothetical protein